MYTVNCRIRGTSPILQHAFTGATLEGLLNATEKKSTKPDYSLEWMDTMYQSAEGLLYQPSTHIEGSLVKAGLRFTQKGKKTFKDVVRAYVYVEPEEILHIRNNAYVPAPDASLLTEPTDYLKVNIMRVIVNRAAVARARLEIAPGWELAFQMHVTDDVLEPSTLKAIFDEATRAVGIGDFRPKYGRSEIVQFDVA